MCCSSGSSHVTSSVASGEFRPGSRLLFCPRGLPPLRRNLAAPRLRRSRPRRSSRVKPATAASLEDLRSEDRIGVPDYVVDAPPSTPAPHTDTWLDDAFDQTLYVEKDYPAPSLLHPEVITEPPLTSSLVPISRPAAPVHDTKRIFAEILAIALPALGTVLADPLMSLIDTACVGQISAVQLAALGPNTAIFNMVFAILGVMGAALANRMARISLKAPCLSKKEKNERRQENEIILSHTLIVATVLGVAVTTGLFACGPGLLRSMGTTATVMPAALHYLYVRAVATPAVLFIAVAQGACLGQQDMWTPMKVALAAGVVNLVGDVALIVHLGLGTFGAAAATAAAQIAGAAYFFFYLRKGGSDGEGVRLKWKGLPTGATLQPIVEMGRILVSRSVVLMLAYTGTTAVATAMGTLALAAHQVVLQLFWFLSFIPEPLSLTAQSLLARDRGDAAKTSRVSQVLLRFGAHSGLMLAALFGGVLTIMPRCFTADPAVIHALQKVIPHGMVALVLCSVSSMFDGICIGTGNLDRLPGIIYAATGVTLGYLTVAHRLSLGLGGIWMSVILFFASRNLLHVTHLIRNWDLSPFHAAVSPPSHPLAEAQLEMSA